MNILLPGVLLHDTTHDKQILGYPLGLFYFSRFTASVNKEVMDALGPPKP